LFIELGRRAGEAHGRSECVVIAFGQLLRHDIDAHLIVLDQGHGEKDGPLPQQRH
jgi:hypothetical protein